MSTKPVFQERIVFVQNIFLVPVQGEWVVKGPVKPFAEIKPVLKILIATVIGKIYRNILD